MDTIEEIIFAIRERYWFGLYSFLPKFIHRPALLIAISRAKRCPEATSLQA